MEHDGYNEKREEIDDDDSFYKCSMMSFKMFLIEIMMDKASHEKQ